MATAILGGPVTVPSRIKSSSPDGAELSTALSSNRERWKNPDSTIESIVIFSSV